MTDNSNPYRPLDSIEETPSDENQVSEGLDAVAFVAWPVVFGLNMIVPLAFGWDLARDHGRMGVCIAALFLLVAGWILCLRQRSIARKLILGATVTALSQFFPVFQFLAGIVAFAIAVSLGVAADGSDDGPIEITSELGGFVVTVLVGGMLLIGAAITGLLLGLVLPYSWFQPNSLVRKGTE
jgi:hypothetical protein